jgi:hypothetical protein
MWAQIIGQVAGMLPAMAESFVGFGLEDEAARKEAALGEAPKFETPESQIAFEESMRKRIRQGMPGATQMREDMDATAATSMGASARAGGTQAAGLGGANLALDRRKKGIRQLGIANQQFRSLAEAQRAEAVKSGAQYEIAEYEYNEWLPWQIASHRISTMAIRIMVCLICKPTLHNQRCTVQQGHRYSRWDSSKYSLR